ncbi:sensor histidine kinase [Streptomyces sp. NPDC059118]|uniref:sensor histidine kinase n=1 Tax=unclassified Streptomyces TaxID=2593676 RepID=UPI0036758FFC
MSDLRRSSHRKAAPSGGVPSSVPPVLVVGAAGASLWAASLAAEIPAGGVGALGAVGVAGAVWWARCRDRVAEQVLAAGREELARTAARAQAARSEDLARRMLKLIADGQAELEEVLAQAEQGEPVILSGSRLIPEALPDGPLGQVVIAIRRAQGAAAQAVLRAVDIQPTSKDEGAELLVLVAQRLHALVNRTLKVVFDAQQTVEDPALLRALFRIDNLVTRTRRTAESIAVLGGHIPRQVVNPVGLGGVLQQAISETEYYPRARRVMSDQISYIDVPGYAAADVIHLLAQLIENATRFSAPHTFVTVSASTVSAGVVIDIDDRGLPMPPQRLAEMNRVLINPDEANRRELLERGTIGLLVVALIAKRHGIRVDLRNNVLGGTQALVVLPQSILVHAPTGEPHFAVRSSPAGQGHQAPPAPGRAAPVRSGSGPVPGPPAVGPRQPRAAEPGLPRRPPVTGQPPGGDAQRPSLPRRGTAETAHPCTPASCPSAAPGTPPDPDFVRAWHAGAVGGRSVPADPVND